MHVDEEWYEEVRERSVEDAVFIVSGRYAHARRAGSSSLLFKSSYFKRPLTSFPSQFEPFQSCLMPDDTSPRSKA